MTPLERLRSSQDWAAIGTVLLVLSFLAAGCCTVMGFDWKPLDHLAEHWSEQADRYRLALAGTVVLCVAAASAFGMAIRRAGTEPTLATWGVIGIVLVVVALWFAVHGAETNIEQADTWATAPPM